VEPPRSPQEGYHLTEDLADHAISFIADAKQVAPDKPFYLHFCPGATHAPHHVAKEWADRYAGLFDEGWDAYRRGTFAPQKELGVIPADAELSRHDPDVPEWESLSPDARKLASRMMEVYAGFLSHTDAQIGRMLDFLRETGELTNTLIMVVSDNGAIAARGEVREQYAHIIDMVPTVLDVLGLEPPTTIRGVTQAPLHGVSFAYSFAEADAPTRHYTQYFEMFGHRAIDHNGWRAVCPWPGPSFAEAEVPFGTAITAETLAMLDAEHWELYNSTEDFSENYDVAADNRSKVELIAQWYVEAGRYNVLPIDGTAVLRLMTERPQLTQARTSYTFWPNTAVLPAAVAPRVYNRPHSITADVEIPPGGAEGVLLCQGANTGGFTFYLRDQRLHYAYNYLSRAIYRVSTADPLTEGKHLLRFEFEPTSEPDFAQGKGSSGRAQLYVDDELMAQAELPVTVPVIFNPGVMACGANHGSPIVADYPAPFRFTGLLRAVTVDVSGELIIDSEAEMRMAMSRQ
jgi:hypothetical protein